MKKKNIDDVLMNSDDDGGMALFTEIEANSEGIDFAELAKELPILALRNMVLFPGVVMPVNIGRRSTLKLVNEALKNKNAIVLATQNNAEVEVPKKENLYPEAVIGRVLRIFEMPGKNTTAIIQASNVRVRIENIVQYSPYLWGVVSPLEEEALEGDSVDKKALIDALKEQCEHYIQVSDRVPTDLAFAVKNMSDELLINFVCSNFPLDLDDKMKMLAQSSLRERAYILMRTLSREINLAGLRNMIQQRTRDDLDKQQRDYFLQQQVRNIMEELGDGEQNDIEELREKAKKKKWGAEVAKIFEKEISKLEHINTQSPDYNVQLSYLQTLIDLPWNVYTTDALQLNNAEKTLNKDHYGLEKVKERILEHLAVLKLRNDLKSPILCLYGPPGVGKTSLGKSIATSLKRKYIRMSLGGVHDEAEIRGHRRTYIGAMPGRILKSMIKAGSSNPVILLDEIDKLGSDHRGDPSSALLEVLDPEQNNTFHDNYVDIDYDLSKVFFIATANNLSTIPQPLLDRMELIEVSGYITEEKVEIARRHLIPKGIEAHGMEKKMVKFSKDAIEMIIENYTRESGVRELEKKINKVLRKVALEIEKALVVPPKEIKGKDIPHYLGAVEYTRDKYQGNKYAGVVIGLAWTAVGGEILFVETSLSKSKNAKLTLTGNLGDVMKESAVIALEYLKSHPEVLGVPTEVYDEWNIHIHVPEGAIPKDGPSAGITMVTSLASAFTQRKVKDRLAMTGEITLRGKVLPVGGIKEKILAAKRAGIQEIILCSENRKNIEEIPQIYLEGLTFRYVSDIKEVLAIALTDEKVEDSKNIVSATENKQ